MTCQAGVSRRKRYGYRSRPAAAKRGTEGMENMENMENMEKKADMGEIQEISRYTDRRGGIYGSV